jgi:short-subunit dehydrogenase
VCIGDVHAERGRDTERELQEMGLECVFVSCDVTSEKSLFEVSQTLDERWGGVDVVVNNAGVAHAGTFDATDLEDWQPVIDINLLGVVRGCKVFLPTFKRQGHGHFVNMASVAGLLSPPNMSIYNVTKTGVVSLSETLREELRPHNVFVTVVCPAFVKTNLAESMRGPDPKAGARLEAILDAASLTAEGVANEIFVAIEKGQFWVVPGRQTRYIWYLKRWLPLPAFSLAVRLLKRLFR